MTIPRRPRRAHSGSPRRHQLLNPPLILIATYQGADQFLTVLRFNTDGSVASSFGTDGQVAIPTPGPYNSVAPVGNVAIVPDGGNCLAAERNENSPLGSPDAATSPLPEHVVVRLTSAGQLDPSFGTEGRR